VEDPAELHTEAEAMARQEREEAAQPAVESAEEFLEPEEHAAAQQALDEEMADEDPGEKHTEAEAMAGEDVFVGNAKDFLEGDRAAGFGSRRELHVPKRNELSEGDLKAQTRALEQELRTGNPKGARKREVLQRLSELGDEQDRRTESLEELILSNPRAAEQQHEAERRRQKKVRAGAKLVNEVAALPRWVRR
jgi:hypothetical protein